MIILIAPHGKPRTLYDCSKGMQKMRSPVFCYFADRSLSLFSSGVVSRCIWSRSCPYTWSTVDIVLTHLPYVLASTVYNFHTILVRFTIRRDQKTKEYKTTRKICFGAFFSVRDCLVSFLGLAWRLQRDWQRNLHEWSCAYALRKPCADLCKLSLAYFVE